MVKLDSANDSSPVSASGRGIVVAYQNHQKGKGSHNHANSGKS